MEKKTLSALMKSLRERYGTESLELIAQALIEMGAAKGNTLMVEGGHLVRELQAINLAEDW